MNVWWRSKPAEVRFWLRVRADDSLDGCWLWTGLQDKDGYGQMRRNKRPGEQKGRMVKAARFAWEMENGPMPDGMFALHRCDNPPCVRPSHIYPGLHLTTAGMSESGNATRRHI